MAIGQLFRSSYQQIAVCNRQPVRSKQEGATKLAVIDKLSQMLASQGDTFIVKVLLKARVMEVNVKLKMEILRSKTHVHVTPLFLHVIIDESVTEAANAINTPFP
jgi:hypothetical protein